MPIAFIRRPRFLDGLAKLVGAVTLGATLLVQAPAANAQSNEKYAAFVIDAGSGKVLFDRYADEPRFPASLTKMMTLYMMFEALETGRARTSTAMNVSAYAAARPPSKLGMKVGSTITVEEAMLALVTRSANDASVVMGEFLGGSESRFADMMTQKARSIGMSRTTFKNANGLPNPGQVTTARDMATLGIALREHFPQYYKLFSTRQFKFRGQTIGNHNRLLGRVEGVDGIKTGYINASGFNLVTSVVRGNRKLVAVVMGGRSGASRDNHMADLVKTWLPKASERRGGPLLASWSPTTRGARALPPTAATAVAAVSTMPTSVPVPTLRDDRIDARVAAAYGSNATSAVNALTTPAPRPLVGRDAVRAALAPESGRRTLSMPTVNSLASTGPVPRAAIPNAPIDRMPTGSIASQVMAAAEGPTQEEEGSRSGWVVQIAATPNRETALDMLGEAKRSAGAALADAEAFTEAVTTGSQQLYRARFAGFDDKASANAACEALKQRSYACYAISN